MCTFKGKISLTEVGIGMLAKSVQIYKSIKLAFLS